MEKLTLKLKDESKRTFLLEVLKHFEFVEIEESNEKSTSEKTKEEKEHDFFSGIGMWADRNIDAENLRKEAWKRTGR